MKKNRLTPGVLALILLVSCSPKVYNAKTAVPDDLPDGGAYTERTVPVVYKVIPDGSVTLRFYDDMPDVAYISAADFQSVVLPGSTMVVTHTGPGEYSLANADATAYVNVNRDVFTCDEFEAFTNQMGLLQPGMANVYYDGMPFVRYKSVTYMPAIVPTTLDFAPYGIDIRSDGKGAVYFPFATLADMYTDLFYHHTGFNGEKVVANTSVNEVSLSEIDPDYFAPLLAKKTRPADLAEFTYKELCFAMDHFYGFPGRIQYNDAIKTKGLDKALEEDIPSGKEMKKLVRSTDLVEYFAGMTGLTGVFYDGHTALDVMSTALGDNREKYSDLVSSYTATTAANQQILISLMSAIVPMMTMVADMAAIRTQRGEAYGDAGTYIKKGDTAVCIFDTFHGSDDEAWKAYYAGTGPMPTQENTKDDCMVVFLDALKKAAADPEVKNFIIDITANGGGSADIVVAMTSLIMDKCYISQDNALTGQRSIVDYEVDRNFDGVFDEKDKDVKYDLNFAVLTSDVSFSCGNLFPSMLKDNGIPVMGEQSGGGSCAIQAMCTADGFCFQISSFRARLNSLPGQNIDEGVVPDIPISTVGEARGELSEEIATGAKNYKAFFDIDNLRTLLLNYKK